MIECQPRQERLSKRSTAMADLQEGFWDNLLDYIQDRTVIPVIGPELVTVREEWRNYISADKALPEDLRGPARSAKCD
jgi:hypothetical protein